MRSKKEPADLRERTTVRIPWGHLNPQLQRIIGEPGMKLPKKGRYDMRESRRLRVGLWAETAVVGYIGASGAPAVGAVFGLPAAFGAKLASNLVRYRNELLLSSMQEYGILQPKSEIEGLYPERWIDTAEVAKTHPLCYVAQNGDLVLRKPTRLEYYRYLYQQRVPGLVGTPWRWRIYLVPPKAPEKVREWAKAKLQKELPRLKSLAPRPLPKPVPVPVKAYRTAANRPSTRAVLRQPPRLAFARPRA